MNFQYCYSKDTKVRILTLEIIFSLRKEKKRRNFHVFMFDKIYDYKFSEKRLRKIRNFPYDHQSIYRENRFIICNIQFITSSCWNE